MSEAEQSCGTYTLQRYAGRRVEQHFHCKDLGPGEYHLSPCRHAPETPRLTYAQMCDELNLTEDERKTAHP